MKRLSALTNSSFGTSLLMGALIVCSASPSLATLTPERTDRGEQILRFDVPGRAPELCVIPHHFDGGKYSDKDLATEQALCSLNFRENVAICPKLNSTNPGINVYKIPDGYSREQVERMNCEVKDGKKNLAKKLAKYKLSTSCSYTPSLLGYYHLSRILGKVANVPPAVLRTFDIEDHKRIAESARTQIARMGKSDDIIQQTWDGLESALKAGGSSRRKDQLMTDNYDQSYGALIKNPNDEEFYKEFFTRSSGSETRAQAFRDRNPIYARLSNSADVSRLVGSEFTQENVESFVQLKDASEMILMDTIMNQQDRFGNIHYQEKWYYRDPSATDKKGNPKIKSEGKLTQDEVNQLGAVRVKEMVLKDNDCGVSKDNMAKKAHLLERVAHMDPSTYKRLMKFAAVIDQDDVKQKLKIGSMFTQSDYESVRDNLKDAASMLQNACRAGRLKLDLDLEAHFSGRPQQPASCD